MVSLFFFFLLHHLAQGVAVAVTDNSLSPSYPPLVENNLFLACGWSGNTSTANGQTWVGDVNSQYSPSEKNASTTTFDENKQVPYSKSRFSHSQFTYVFNVTAGQKFIRLHFYPASKPEFNFYSSAAFFSVKAGSFTLLSNFSAALTADALRLTSADDTFFKEFSIHIEEDQRLLSITFTPSPDYKNSFAFINGIEIVSMPLDLYYSSSGVGFKFVGQENPYSISNSNAMETLYRINVGGQHISPSGDAGGMYRTWVVDDYYLTDAGPSVLPVNTSIALSFSHVHNYSAPEVVYKTARTMGLDKDVNEKYNLTWEFEVDSGYTYFLRLHFCEFQIEVTEESNRVFQIFINNLTAEAEADVIAWSGGNGMPIYRDYALMIGSPSKLNEKIKQNLSIALHPAPRWRTNYSDAILNGLEIFKVDNAGILAGPNPEPPTIRPNPDVLPTTRTKNRAALIGIFVGVASGFGVLSLVLLLFFRRAREVKDPGSSTGTTSVLGAFFSSNRTKTSRGSFLPSELCTHFTLSEITAATNNFDKVLIIGFGGFGNVYKGFIDGSSSTTPVAIKRLNPESQQGALEFQTEIGMLSQLRHIHLVSLIGYCNDDREMILVYQFMARGTLRDHLYNSDNPRLEWDRRLEICIGAARGLHYLHTGGNHVIIHRDVKTSNILLDEKWVAKVSDFGLSKFGPTSVSKTHVSTIVKGSIGYLDPEYYRLQQLTEKSDVYSFGVVLLEVLCARPPILKTAEKKQASLAAWAQQCYRNGIINEIVDPYLKGKIKPECLNKFTEVAMSCLNDDGSKRPSMSDVVWGLEFALQLQEIAKEKEEEQHNLNNVYEIDDDSDDLLSRHVFSDLKTISNSTVTISTSIDDQRFSTQSFDMHTGAVFSEIMNAKGR